MGVSREDLDLYWPPRPAAELTLTSPGVCPLCHQRMPETKGRVCGSCRKPIKRGHKFTHDGPTVRHHDCERPTERRKGETS